jgi:hypothetical protein
MDPRASVGASIMPMGCVYLLGKGGKDTSIGIVDGTVDVHVLCLHSTYGPLEVKLGP